MGATYTRQSTYADGDTITAAHTNDEFDQLLAAFAASTGHTHDGTTGEGGPISTMAGHALTFGQGTAGTDIVITFDGETNDGVLKWMEDEDYFEFSDDILIATSEKIQFRDTAIYINSSADGQLDLVADTEIQIAATTIDINGLVDISGNLSVGGNLDVTGTFDLSDSNFTNAGDIQLDSISGDSDTNTSIAFSGSDVITITTGGETQITFNNGSILPTTDNDVDLGSSSLEFKDIYIDGTAYLDAINFNGTAISATAAELNIMDGVTSTAAELNILDGVTATAAELNILDVSNTTIGDLSEISTVANDDVFLAVDTSGGGLKKITRSNIVSGLATSSALSNVVEDTSPQLGGNLDLNGSDIVTTSNATLDLAPNGTGTVVVRGNTNSGAVVFNCESNSHGQKVYGQPHSAGVTNTLMLPAGANSTLVSLVSTDTLTNKTLTAPKIADGGFLADANGNELVVFQTTSSAVNQLEITNNASGSNPILAATGGDTNIGIALTPKGTGEIVIGAGNLNYGGTAVTATGAELNILDGVTSTAAELNILDGVTSTAAELNILDGVTSTAAELNILDGVTSTAAELNLLDGNTSVGGSITVADADGFVVNDGGTMKTIPATDIKTYASGSSATKGFAIAMAIVFG